MPLMWSIRVELREARRRRRASCSGSAALSSEIALIHDRSVAMQQEDVFFAREIVAPETAIFPNDEVSVIAITRPCKRRRGIEPDLLFAERQLAAFEDEQSTE
jgi:hypothetical protein